jgi:hypothetical protein
MRSCSTASGIGRVFKQEACAYPYALTGCWIAARADVLIVRSTRGDAANFLVQMHNQERIRCRTSKSI